MDLADVAGFQNRFGNDHLLQGQPGDLLVGAVKDFEAHRARVTDDEISIDPAGAELARTVLEIVFFDEATVGEANALLVTINGTIVSMLEGVGIITVRITDPGSLAALDAVVADIEAQPTVRHVNKGYFHQLNELPSNYSPGSPELSKVDHHLATRAHAAWNARAALQHPGASAPLVIVYDSFGDGPPKADFDTLHIDSQFGAGSPDSHGYHVLGIIAGTFGGAATDRGLVTGIYPGITDLAVVDREKGYCISTADNRVLHLARSAGRNVILNTSLSVCESGPTPCIPFEPPSLILLAVNWIDKVRALTQTGRDLEQHMLHVTAAGNIEHAAHTLAKFDSYWASAKLLPGLVRNPFQNPSTPVLNLTNTLVIENTINDSAAPFEPMCLNKSSKRGGNLSGNGTDVWSLTNAASTAGNNSGTSMSTPQVAGLGAYVWTLRPNLTPQQVMEVLVDTANPLAILFAIDPNCDPNVFPAPVVDAYAAVLATDQDFFDAPVRLAILDVAGGVLPMGGNNAFDEFDVALLLDQFQSAAGNLDFSRYDLNGDAHTGGSKTDRFDLDITDPLAITNPPIWDTVIQTIEGRSVSFDEKCLTDAQILCYYAYSPLYTGDPAFRTFLLGDAKCGAGWSPLGTGMNGPVYTLTDFNDGTGAALFAGGDFTNAGGVSANYIAKWDGTTWSALGTGMNDSVYTLTDFNDGTGPALYAGGDFTTAGGVSANRIAKWDGTTWSALGTGVNQTVLTLTGFNDGTGPALYEGGNFVPPGGASADNIAKWDGSSWSPLGPLFGDVATLTVFDDGSGPALYAGGNFVPPGGVSANRIAKLNGTTWSPLGTGMYIGGRSIENSLVFTLFGDGPALYAGGRFSTGGFGGTLHGIAKWDGGASWSPLGSIDLGIIGVVGVITEPVLALTNFEDCAALGLYAGGYFPINPARSYVNIARWHGSSWSPLGTEMNSVVRALTVFDDGTGPALYAGGDFTTAGGVSAYYIAKWSLTGGSP